MKKVILLVFLVIIAVSAAIAYSKYRGYESFKAQPVEINDEILITIEKGSNWKKVASILKNEGIITDDEMFYRSEERRVG